MDVLVSQLLDEALANVNIALVIALMGVGFLVKHMKFLEKVENSLIPPILLILSIVATVFSEGFTVASVITGIVNAAIAVGLHQQGKNIFSVSIVPSLTKFFKIFAKSEVESEEPEVEDTEEEVDEIINE